MGLCIPVTQRMFMTRAFTRCVGNESVKYAMPVGAGGSYSVNKLSTDAIGTCDIRIQNAVTGSRYRIEVSSTGTLAAEGDVASNDFTVNVPLYPAGNAANTLKVKIRKGTSSPYYRPFESQVTLSASGASTYVIQETDE